FLYSRYRERVTHSDSSAGSASIHHTKDICIAADKIAIGKITKLMPVIIDTDPASCFIDRLPDTFDTFYSTVHVNSRIRRSRSLFSKTDRFAVYDSLSIYRISFGI